MSNTPSEHPNDVLSDPSRDFYLPSTRLHQRIEQSAIYADIQFDSIGEPDNAILLTSQCDIGFASSNELVLLARVISLEEFILYYLMEKNSYSEEEALGTKPVTVPKKRREMVINNLLSSYMKNDTFQYYFIPALNGVLEPSMITFDVVQCKRVESLQSVKKIAVPVSPFREAIPTRYSAYIGRIGTPSLDKSYLRKVVEDGCLVVDAVE